MRIISDATLCTDFDACVNLFQDFIEQCGTMHTPGHQQGAQLAYFKGETKASMGINKLAQVEDCYYKKEEYDALTPEQRKCFTKYVGTIVIKRVPRIVPSCLIQNQRPRLLLKRHSLSI